MGRGVVLHLVTGGECIEAGPFGRRTESGIAHPAGERAVGDRYLVFGRQEFAHAGDIALGTFEGRLEIGQGDWRRITIIRCGTWPQDAPHGVTR
jgi:hypothetical protein